MLTLFRNLVEERLAEKEARAAFDAQMDQLDGWQREPQPRPTL